MKRWFFEFILLPLVILALCFAICEARTQKDETLKTFAVGTSLVFEGAFLNSPDLSAGHVWELEGFSYMGTHLGFKFFPKDFNWISPGIVALIDAIWRIPEFGKGHDDLIFRKCLADGSGILGAVIEFKF